MGRTRRKRLRKYVSAVCNSDVPEFLKWLKFKDKNLQIRSFPTTGRGIRSRKTIRAGEDLISLPLHLLITPKVDNEVTIYLDKASTPPNLLLAIFFMYECHLGENSKYYRYIKLLPSDFTTLFFCKENEVHALPNFMRHEVLQQIEQINQHYATIINFYFSKPCPHCGLSLNNIFEYSLFTWAWFTVNTRSVYYQDEKDNSVALAPFLDMFNHSVDAETEMRIDKKQKTYIIRTLKRIRKFEQIFISYGAHSNWKLLKEYGFIQENNPHDFVQFTFDDVLTYLKNKTKYGDISKLKYKFIKKNDLDVNLRMYKEESSWNLNALLFLLVTEDENLSSIYAKSYSNEFNQLEQDKINELMKILVKSKREELMTALNFMETIKNCSEGFSFAKQLIKIYINFLTY